MQPVAALSLALALALAAPAHAQFFQSLPVLTLQQPQAALQAPAPAQPAALQHRAVVLNSEAEARLPPQLQNPFYKNPRIEAALAKESWFTAGEQQVLNREADKIPREKIFSILKNAGLARRR
ncbi:hypothetical protein R5R35_014420 [Gryllus longicercus]|uniref:Accessory gland protein n=1 Tax=Gryllus longicercus TaxID=2509291 RepID=A0AAN9VV51_9ORTH